MAYDVLEGFWGDAGERSMPTMRSTTSSGSRMANRAEVRFAHPARA